MSKIITQQQLESLQSELQSIESQRQQKLSEQEKLTEAYVQQQQVLTSIGQFMLEKHNFHTFEEFKQWYDKALNTPKQWYEQVPNVPKRAIVHPYPEELKSPITAQKPKTYTDTNGTANKLLKRITEWLTLHRMSKSDLSKLIGHSDSYVNQQYYKAQNPKSASRLKQTQKVLSSIISYLHECDNPEKLLNSRHHANDKFTVSIKKPEYSHYKYYADEQPQKSITYLDMSYTSKQYNAKVLDKESVKRFYTNFVKEHPNVPITLLVIPTDELPKYTHTEK